MSELISNLNTIESCKLDIKSAIEAKGVDMTSASLPDYASAIGSITTQFVTTTLSVSQNGTYTPGQGVDGYSEVVVSVPQSGTGFTDVEVTEGKINIVNLSNSASFVSGYAFGLNSYLQTVNLTECLFVGDYGFNKCYNLTQVNLPKCSILKIYAFRQCSSLTEVSLPNCSSLGSYALYQCSSLSYINLPACRTVESAALGYCQLLSEVSLPVVSYFSGFIFYSCPNLKSLTMGTETYLIPSYVSNPLYGTKIINGQGSIYVASDMYSRWIVTPGWASLSNRFVSVNQSGPVLSISDGVLYGITRDINYKYGTFLGIQGSNVLEVSLPCVEEVGYITFSNCTSLTSVNLPVCKILGSSAFQDCTSLSYINLPVCSMLYQLALYVYQGVHMDIILGYNGVVSTEGRVFDETKNMSIYVPSSLVNAYKEAQYWSMFSSKIFPISE